MSDKEFLFVLAVALTVVQFLYRVWDKKDNKLVMTAITAAVESFGPHIERTQKTHNIVRDLKNMHDVRDDDGRPLWYMPKEILETQRDIVATQHLMAENQRNTLLLMEKVLDKVDRHHDNCKDQFAILKTEKNGGS